MSPENTVDKGTGEKHLQALAVERLQSFVLIYEMPC